MYSYVIKLIFVIQLPIISASGCGGYVNYSSKNRTTPGNIVQLWARLGCGNKLGLSCAKLRSSWGETDLARLNID